MTREQALDEVSRGKSFYGGMTRPQEFGPHHHGCWIINRGDKCEVAHVEIDDDEPLIGCLECGFISQPEVDRIGCGCHCPVCGATL